MEDTFVDTTLASTRMMCNDSYLMNMESDFQLDEAVFDLVETTDLAEMLRIETASGATFSFTRE